jgi:hypothetical protein
LACAGEKGVQVVLGKDLAFDDPDELAWVRRSEIAAPGVKIGFLNQGIEHLGRRNSPRVHFMFEL